MNNQKYRPEIDGLRAIAVLAVLFYHLGFPAFTGGFVGVDVFFVISGFLITRLILVDVQSGSFSFTQFFIRRARRLFPSVLAVLAMVFIVAAFMFSPEDFARVGKTASAAVFSFSNVVFWLDAGYFDVDAAFKPLLHTWSLSVEEQFYAFWPVFIVLAYKVRSERILFLLMFGMGIASLAFSEVWVDGDPEAAFFLTPFRVFEFVIGGLLVWVERFRTPGARAGDALLLLGLLIVGYSVVSFKEGMVFPGLSALVPCVGAALVIYAGNGRVARLLLANPVAVKIGKISYSLYLVHWPIIVFYHYYHFEQPTPMAQALMLAGSFVAALVLHEAVEKPFRHGVAGRKPLRAPAYFGSCALSALMLAGPATHASRKMVGSGALVTKCAPWFQMQRYRRRVGTTTSAIRPASCRRRVTTS